MTTTFPHPTHRRRHTTINSADAMYAAADGDSIALSYGCGPGESALPAGTYYLQFQLAALDNLDGGGAYSITATDSCCTTTLASGDLSELTPDAEANINGLHSGCVCSYCGTNYVPDPEYDFFLPMTLAASPSATITINVTGMDGGYTAGTYAIDNVVFSRDPVALQTTARTTSGTGALISWANDADASEYVVLASTDSGSTFNAVGYAGTGDTGMLVTGLTSCTAYVFEVAAFSDDGSNDALGSVSISTGAIVSGDAGVYTIASPDSLTVWSDAPTYTSDLSGLTINNATVAAGSKEEAVLMAFGGSATTTTGWDSSVNYTPLSGAFTYADDYYTTNPISSYGGTDDTLAAETDIGQALAFSDTYQPDGGSYAYNAEFLKLTVTKTATFSASVQANPEDAALDTLSPASFVLSRAGDISASGTVNFHMYSSTVSEADYVLTGQDDGALSYDSGTDEFTYTFAAGESQATITLTPNTGVTDTGTVELHLDTGSYNLGAAAFFGYNFVTEPEPEPGSSSASVGVAATAPTQVVVQTIVNGPDHRYVFSVLSTQARDGNGHISLPQSTSIQVLLQTTDTATTPNPVEGVHLRLAARNPGGAIADGNLPTMVQIDKKTNFKGEAGILLTIPEHAPAQDYIFDIYDDTRDPTKIIGTITIHVHAP